jgi:hypothetical protein
MRGADAVRDALKGIEAAFGDARRRRLELIRALAALPAPPALVEALLRREAIDADPTAGAQDRAVRIHAEHRRATAALDDLDAPSAARVRPLMDELGATWTGALTEAARLASGLAPYTDPPVAAAVVDYVRALTAAHAAADDRDALLAAIAGLEAATARLAQTLAG